ncbi:MAG: MFS transporter [Thermoplasmatota archaeon]
MPPSVSRPLMGDGVCSRVMDALSSGPFLAGVGLFAGAGTFGLGVLAALPYLSQVAQLPAVWILARVRDRRAVVIGAAGLSRLAWGALAILLLSGAPLRIPTLFAILAASAVLSVVATAAWSWWMRDLIPSGALGAFFGRRMRVTTLLAAIVVPVAGWVLDRLSARHQAGAGYGLLFATACVVGLLGLVFLARTPHTPSLGEPGHRSRLRGALFHPETRRALVALSLVAAAVTFSLPFTSIFLLRDLRYGYLLVALLVLVSQVGYFSGLRGWGHLSDRLGDRAVLYVCTSLLGFTLIVWAVAGWARGVGSLFWMTPLHFLTGFSLGGLDLGGTNLMLKVVPRAGAPAHLAAIGLGKAACAGTGTILAGALWQALGAGALWNVTGKGWSWGVTGFQVLSFVAGAWALLALFALARVEDPRGASMVEVPRAMRREVPQMSSVAGMRVFLHAVSYSVEWAAGPLARRARSGSQANHAPPK